MKKMGTNFQWILSKDKFLTSNEIKRLRNLLAKRERIAKQKGNKVAIRDWFIVSIGLSTGLRVQEIADLRCGDICLDGHCYVFVRNGKGGKQRIVRFNGEFCKHITEYLEWKNSIGESITDEAPLICSSKKDGCMSKRAIQEAFKRSALRAGLSGHSIHHLRHTYASHLYKASKYNLRLVQKQLGHSSIKTTQVYADVFDEDMEKALERLYE